MHASIQGSLDQIDRAYKAFTHNGKRMTKQQVLAVLTYAKKAGYETTAELKDLEVDEIIKDVDAGILNQQP